jgi:hypothetical protein
MLLRPVQKDVRPWLFPGSNAGFGQFFVDAYHKSLTDLLVTIPNVAAGDMVFWHPDLIHAVEPTHQGDSSSDVIYIAPLPLCERNAKYLQAQRNAWIRGRTPPDFPQLDAEQHFEDRSTPDHFLRHIQGDDAHEVLSMHGLAPWRLPPQSNTSALSTMIHLCNDLAGHASPPA